MCEPTFAQLRPRLLRLAYRMLGSLADAEDAVQDAWLGWLAVDRDRVHQPAAWLYTAVTRRCLNQLKSARRRRAYPGPWLPEPIVSDPEPEWADDWTLPLMLALQRLSPLERAAFLLHDVFGLSFDEVAASVGRTPATCRQLASRARKHIHAARPRFPVTRERGLEIAAAFFAASRHGDLNTLRALLASDVSASADGGGKVPATAHPLAGIERVMECHARLAQDFAQSPSRLISYAIIDGLPGFITVEAGGIAQTTALQVEREKIAAIYVVRNPDKLRHLPGIPKS